ncbi:MATE family efflux transporter [Solimonas marina]|uniref:Multidrug-efflux transporter n=1 Tax=Solimonas marina TaxID=2714601 RepID=A0A970BA69_9GAMM|nr:MATE family efflux transporter [Solimonas marina]NKF23076.1 MATE family efflux transporter [Solimonas marina]
MAAQDLTSGPVRGHLLRMSGFMLLTMLMQTLYSIIDLFWVGRLGREAIAAVALGGNLMMVVMAVGQTLAIGAAALIAQAAGRKDMAEARRLFTQAQSVSGVLAVLLLLLMYAGRGLYGDTLAGDLRTAALTREFLGPFIPALALQVPMFVLSAALRGVGDVRTASIAQLVTVVLNMMLAPVLIFGWGSGHPLGVAGAALATLISIALGVAGLLLHVVRKTQFFSSEWRLAPRLAWRMMRIGLPSGAELALMAVYMSFIMAMLQRFGPAPQAAFGIGMRILQAGMMPCMAVTFATAAIVGQNYGAGHGARIREAFMHALRFNLVVATLFCIAFHVAPAALIRPFSHDPQVLVAGADFLRWIAWNQIAVAVIFACSGVFSGFGNTLPSLIGSATRIGAVMGGGLLLSRDPRFSPVWLWVLSVSASVGQLIINVVLLRRELHRRLPPAPEATTADAPL